MATPRLSGTASSNASSDVYRVPKMKTSAPKWSVPTLHCWLTRKLSPKRVRAGHDCTTRVPTITTATTRARNAAGRRTAPAPAQARLFLRRRCAHKSLRRFQCGQEERRESSAADLNILSKAAGWPARPPAAGWRSHGCEGGRWRRSFRPPSYRPAKAGPTAFSPVPCDKARHETEASDDPQEPSREDRRP